MAIDFPNSPVNGTTYSFSGVTYTYDATTSPGYWRITTVGTVGIASTAEVDTGTEAVKYITPDSLEGSKYVTTTDLVVKVTLPSETNITGSIVYTNSTNNMHLTGIGSIGLAIGDVIIVSGTASNDGLYTVEILSGANNIIVNQAHAGGSSNKSLTDETVSSTVTLSVLAKNAPLGYGQTPADMLASRALSVTYTNNTGRVLWLSICHIFAAGGSSGSILVDGVAVMTVSHSSTNVGGEWHFPIPVGSTYSKTGTTISIWTEVR